VVYCGASKQHERVVHLWRAKIDFRRLGSAGDQSLNSG
jgi:hypothetical protein